MAVIEEHVNFPWAICIAREDAAALGLLRLAAGVEVGDDGASVWLRGQPGDERLETKLAGLPARDRYEWVPPNLLRPMARRIPSARLPEIPWQPLNAWLQIETPAAALPGNNPAAIPLRLVRSTSESEPELLLTSLDELKQFAALAAQVRLDRLQFAASAEGSVLVRGRPLPPLPGRRFVLHGGVAVPAGFSWEPAVGAEVLARRFGVSGDTLVLWAEGGTVARLHGEQFVPVSRSALRATEHALGQPP
jgi:hypothetical protein